MSEGLGRSAGLPAIDVDKHCGGDDDDAEDEGCGNASARHFTRSKASPSRGDTRVKIGLLLIGLQSFDQFLRFLEPETRCSARELDCLNKFSSSRGGGCLNGDDSCANVHAGWHRVGARFQRMHRLLEAKTGVFANDANGLDLLSLVPCGECFCWQLRLHFVAV